MPCAFLSFAIFTTSRGTIVDNIWWVIVARDSSTEQTGVLNAIGVGRGHFSTGTEVVLVLVVMVVMVTAIKKRNDLLALAAFAIFQFLWTWNDYLTANTFAGTNPDARPTAIIIANLAGAFGQNGLLLSAAGSVQTFFQLVIFFALQRYFIRGILASSFKQRPSRLVVRCAAGSVGVASVSWKCDFSC
ncbi:MAG: hypothetical protein ACI83Y_002934 [Candidatus Azotimanducaceae bacterium]